eukprot:COSAG01_NODE_402_length_17510_cov_6.871575_17_plen_281_part_00
MWAPPAAWAVGVTGVVARERSPVAAPMSYKPTFPSTHQVHVGSRMCAFAGRTLWAIHELKLLESFELVDVPLGQERPPWLRELNPSNTVPAIFSSEGERVEGDSAALTDWLIRQSPGGAGSSSESVRAVVQEFDQKVLGPLYAFLRCDAAQGSERWEASRARVEASLAPIEAKFAAASEHGPYFLEEIGLADFVIFSVLYRFQASLADFRRYELVSANRTPCLARGLAAVVARPAFRSATPTPEEIVQWYRTDSTYNPNVHNRMLDDWVTGMVDGTMAAP